MTGTPENSRDSATPGEGSRWGAAFAPFTRLSTWLWLSVLAPLGFVAWRASLDLRDIPYWDEFEAVLGLVVRIDEGVGPLEFIRRLFMWHNEHRMMTSRLLFALEYAVTGRVDFVAIAVIGNLFLAGACLVLVVAAGTAARRLQMAVLLAWCAFQLQQHENFFWAGSSIDHFQVILLGIASMLCLRRNGWAGMAGAAAFAFLAVFTLAHGLAVFPAGALVLAYERRWRHFPAWILWGLAVTALFAHDFQTAPQHGALASLGPVTLYWLHLVGASPGFGVRWLSIALGAVAAGWFGFWCWRGGMRREPFLASVLVFLASALLLIAMGRTGLSGGLWSSRYAILSSLIWALIIFIALQEWNGAARPLRRLAWLMPLLVAFNAAADVRSFTWGGRFAIDREGAVFRHLLTGSLRDSAFRLHPDPQVADPIYDKAEKRGVYRFPELCRQVNAGETKEEGGIRYFLDDVDSTGRGVHLRGWAVIPARAREARELRVILEPAAGGRIAFTARPRSRPDVAESLGLPSRIRCGFEFAIGSDRLPPGPLRVGLAVVDARGAWHIMTDHLVNPRGAGK